MYPHDHPLKPQYYPHLQIKYLLLYYFQILNFTNFLGINNKEAMKENKVKGGNVLVQWSANCCWRATCGSVAP